MAEQHEHDWLEQRTAFGEVIDRVCAKCGARESDASRADFGSTSYEQHSETNRSLEHVSKIIDDEAKRCCPDDRFANCRVGITVEWRDWTEAKIRAAVREQLSIPRR